MILIIFSVLLLGVFAQEKDIFVLPPSEVPRIIETSDNCIVETGADSDSLQKIILWQVQESQVIKDYLYCMMTKAKIADENGHFIKSRTLDLLKEYKKRDEVELALDECNTLQGKDGKDTMFKAVSCYHMKSPLVFAITK